MKLTIDFETRGTVSLPAIGQWAYANHPNTQIMCLAVFDGKDTGVWLPRWVTDLHPIFKSEPWYMVDSALTKLLEMADIIEAHNASFEIAVWEANMDSQVKLPLHKVRCSASQAAMHGLPRALGKACAALGLKNQKSAEGNFLMKKMCVPQKDGTWLEDEASFRGLIDYCRQDVVAEAELSSRLDPLPPSELPIWFADLEINTRGAYVDREFVAAAIRLGDAHKRAIGKEFVELTGGQVPTPGHLQKFLAWTDSLGVRIPGLTKADVLTALSDGVPPIVKRALEIRQSWGKTSVAKYQALFDRIEHNADDRSRDMFMYHAATTGRWGGQGFQPQNLPSRGLAPDIEMAVAAIKAGIDPEEIAYLWGDPLWLLSSCVRSSICAPDGRQLYVADYAAIEARVLAWLMGEEHVLAAYRNHEDLYIKTAAKIYGVPEEKIGKTERQIGKVAVLACIAEGQMVLTDSGEKPIETVTTKDKVWDGVDFVRHKGVVYQGMQEVITHDEVTATIDHRVFVHGESGEERVVYFGDAATCGACLVRSGFGGRGIRVDRDIVPGAQIHKRVARAIRLRTLLRLRRREMGSLGKSPAGKIEGLSVMLPASSSLSSLALQEAHRSEEQMHKRERQGFSQLRREGNNVRLYLRRGCVSVLGGNNWRSRSEHRGRSHRQQQGIYAGEYPIRHQTPEYIQHSSVSDTRRVRVSGTRLAISSIHGVKKDASGHDAGANTVRRAGRSDEQTEMLAANPRTAPCYDILDCGPRNRFTVNGRLVHNCGFSGGKAAFARMAEAYGIVVEEDRAQEVVEAWRKAHPATVAGWREIERAAKAAIKDPGQVFTAKRVAFRVRNDFLRCRLPSGRQLYYPFPSIGEKLAPWGEMIEAIKFWGVNEKGQWAELDTFSGRLTENIVQAIARDLMAEALVRLRGTGYLVVAHVHDEVVAEAQEGYGSVEEYCEIISTLPKWASGCPVEAEGWCGKRYRK